MCSCPLSTHCTVWPVPGGTGSGQDHGVGAHGGGCQDEILGTVTAHGEGWEGGFGAMREEGTASFSVLYRTVAVFFSPLSSVKLLFQSHNGFSL